VATALWAAQVFYASTGGFTSNDSASFLRRLLEAVDLLPPLAVVAVVNTIGRKTAHIAEYAILTLLLYRAASGAGKLIWRPSLAGWCVLAAGIYSVTDELHQAFVPGRGASLLDCGFDWAGSWIAMLLLYRRLTRSRPRIS
jgi:VanZ family protein